MLRRRSRNAATALPCRHADDGLHRDARRPTVAGLRGVSPAPSAPQAFAWSSHPCKAWYQTVSSVPALARRAKAVMPSTSTMASN
jgi:hypothetical protein